MKVEMNYLNVQIDKCADMQCQEISCIWKGLTYNLQLTTYN